MQHILLSFALVATIACSSLAEVNPVFGYHQKYGIPLAKEIRDAEENFINRTDRIVGGATAPVNAYPFLAGLIINFVNSAGQSVCGSTLLSANRLVTAAHCWFDGVNQASLFTVVLGSQLLFLGGTRITTNQVIMHSQWNPNNLSNDVAMIYLPSSIFFTTSIQPVNLPNGNQMFEQFVGEWAIAAGYGKTNDAEVGVSTSTSVQHVQVMVISVAQCMQTFGSTFVQSSTLCTNGAGGVGICGGDSGGPLIIHRNGQPVLIGISSFVAGAGCQLGFPSAFARVTSFLNFINQHM